MTLLLCLAISGCVRRTIVIESDPPGADVFVNHDLEAVGQTPLEIDIDWYGAYRFRLIKAGFEEMTAHEMVRAPAYERVPFDLVAEHLLPFQVNDRRTFRYLLVPYPLGATAKRLEESDASRLELRAAEPSRRRNALIELAAQPDTSMQEAIERSLVDHDPTVRGAAIRAYRLIAGASAGKRIITMLQDDHPLVRAQAAAELEVLAVPDSLSFLLLSLNDRDHTVRSAVIEALGSLGDRQAVEPVIKRLRDRDAGVRRSAADALGRLGDRRAAPGLRRALRRDRNLIVRRRAVIALRRLGDPSAVDALIRALRDRDAKVRDEAAVAIEELSDVSTVPVLLEALEHRHAVVRYTATKAIAKIDDPRIVPALRWLMDRESNPAIQAAAIEAVERLERRTPAP